MFVIGVVPSGRDRTARAGSGRPSTSCRTWSGVGVVGPVKSVGLSSVSCVPPFLRTKPPGPDAGWAMPAPSRYGSGTAVEPNASMTVAPAAVADRDAAGVRRCRCRRGRRPARRSVPAELANTNVWPAGQRRPGRHGGARARGGGAVGAPQLPAADGDRGARDVADLDHLVVAAARAAEGRLGDHDRWSPACAAGAATAATTSAADASAKRRDFTVKESFPEGNPKDSAQPYRCTGRMGDGFVIRRGAGALGPFRGVRVRTSRSPLDPHPAVGGVQADACRRDRSGRPSARRSARRASTAPDGRRCCAAPTSIAAIRGCRRVSSVGQPRVGAAVVGDLQDVDGRGLQRQRAPGSRRRRSAAPRARSASRRVTSALSFGLPIARQPVGARRRPEHPEAQPPERDHLARGGRVDARAADARPSAAARATASRRRRRPRAAAR